MRPFLIGPITLLALASIILPALLVLMSHGGQPPAISEDEHRNRRRAMVVAQLKRRGISSPTVLAAMEKVPRHQFVPFDLRDSAYSDGPLPIGSGQTISQPYIVALMTELIEPGKEMKVLEIGTGSGYQAAVLSECVGEVDTIEVVPELAREAEAVLKKLGHRNVQVRIGDGYAGWPECAPFDAIILTAAPPDCIPQPLLDQLKPGGRLVAPVGQHEQELVRITRTNQGFESKVIAPVRFVPMTGKAQQER